MASVRPIAFLRSDAGSRTTWDLRNERIREGLSMPGVIAVAQSMPLVRDEGTVTRRREPRLLIGRPLRIGDDPPVGARQETSK